MTIPTIGAKVHFRESKHQADPEYYPAVITGTHSDGWVNLSVSHPTRGKLPVIRVPLVQSEDSKPSGPFAEWPKAEAAADKVEVPPDFHPPPLKAEKKPRRKSKKK